MSGASVYLWGRWSLDRTSLVLLAAMLPVLGAAFYSNGTALIPSLFLSLLITFGWQFLFALARGSIIGWDGATTAIAFTILAPTTAPIWESIMALSFGVVVGEQIFGGRGRSFLHPTVVALAFLFFSFPSEPTAPPEAFLFTAALPGAVFLLVLGLISWRVLGAAYAGLGLAAMFAGAPEPSMLMLSGSIFFATVFLGCDPASAAITNPGRILYGLFIGGLTVLFGGEELTAIVFALLLASIFVPLIDQAVVRVHAFRARQRIG
jgi:Na+-transporting NADH:ubiquinone oxidoreductase subunit B